MHLDLPGEHKLALERPIIMGVLNATPDSFSDGGRHEDTDAAARAAAEMLRAGADVLDIGGESTRPGAARIDTDEQIRRIVPIIETVGERHRAPISVDTTHAAVAEAALDAGAAIINDVSAGRDDERIFEVAARRGAPIVLMHMQGRPADMQHDPRYEDVVGEVAAFLLDRAEVAEAAGVPRGQIIIDPGIGFGKTTQHNLQLLANLDAFVQTGRPVLVGASRKRFLGHVTGLAEPAQRDAATAAVTALAVQAGARILRVHNVPPNRQAADVTFAVMMNRTGALRPDAGPVTARSP